MNTRLKFALILAAAAIVIPQGVSAATPNAKLWNGTWHLDAAKSKFASSSKEQSETRTYDISGGKVTVKSSSKDTAGKELNFSYSAGTDPATKFRVGQQVFDQRVGADVGSRDFGSVGHLLAFATGGASRAADVRDRARAG